MFGSCRFMSRLPCIDTTKRFEVQKRHAFSSGNVRAIGVLTDVRTVRKLWNVGRDDEGEVVAQSLRKLSTGEQVSGSCPLANSSSAPPVSIHTRVEKRKELAQLSTMNVLDASFWYEPLSESNIFLASAMYRRNASERVLRRRSVMSMIADRRISW